MVLTSARKTKTHGTIRGRDGLHTPLFYLHTIDSLRPRLSTAHREICINPEYPSLTIAGTPPPSERTLPGQIGRPHDRTEFLGH